MDKIFALDSIFSNELLIVVALILGLLVVVSIAFWVIGHLKPSLDLSELKARTKSWWVMSIVFLLATMVVNEISYVAIAFLSFVAFRELYSILDFRNSDRNAVLWAYLAIPIQYFLAYIGWYGAFIIFIPVVMFLLLPLRLVLKGDTKGIVESMSKLQFTVMLSIFGISHMAYFISLPEIDGFLSGGRGLLLFLVFLTEINDVLQFTFGKIFGKHKIIPSISPNKTWEGFLGGLISTTVIGYFLSFLTPLSGFYAAFASFLIAFAGFSGDIVLSSIKRDIGIKDTSDTIPGHGGILDRIDSLSYTAPVFFHFIYYLAY
ncbi:MAG: phosphatidate cytidylyltransferase [Balneola sp.]|nr:MAG: phosphatidate cytidylyltransferase [Balneola sp.]